MKLVGHGTVSAEAVDKDQGHLSAKRHIMSSVQKPFGFTKIYYF